MPTPAELVDMVREHILDVATTGNRYSDASIILRLNSARQNVARRALCIPQINQTNTLTTTRIYSLPSNFIKTRLVLFYESALTDNPIILTERPLREVEWQSSSNIGRPSHYETWRDAGTIQIRLDSTPAVAVVGGLRLYYYALPTNIVLKADPIPTIDVPEKYHEAIVYRTSSVVLTVDEEIGKAQAMNQLFESEIQRIKSEEERASIVDGSQILDTYDSISGSHWSA